MDDFTTRYREMQDEEIMQLYVDRDELQADAQAAVIAEFNARHLSQEDAVALKRSLLRAHREIERKQGFVGHILFGRWFRRLR